MWRERSQITITKCDKSTVRFLYKSQVMLGTVTKKIFEIGGGGGKTSKRAKYNGSIKKAISSHLSPWFLHEISLVEAMEDLTLQWSLDYKTTPWNGRKGSYIAGDLLIQGYFTSDRGLRSKVASPE